MIRHARAADHPAIREVVAAAFDKTDEADLVERLRASGDVVFELVEEDAGQIVGHILYSRLWADSAYLYAALAPLAVRPDRQKDGVGKRLTKASLESQQKIDAANRQIDALKATVIGLQNTVTQLQGQVQALGKQPNGAAKDAPKEAPKAPAAK